MAGEKYQRGPMRIKPESEFDVVFWEPVYTKRGVMLYCQRIRFALGSKVVLDTWMERPRNATAEAEKG